MKLAMVPAVMCVTASLLGGCSRPQGRDVNPVTAITEDGSAFPAALAGRWKADRHGWEFVFEPDGKIRSVILSLGRVAVFPGQTTTRQTTEGEQAVFAPGPWMVHYDPATRMLTVEIVMDHVRVPMGTSTLEGSSTDTFTGFLSPAMDTWQAEWTAFPHYTARTKEGESIGLATDDTNAQAQSLVFTKTPDGTK